MAHALKKNSLGSQKEIPHEKADFCLKRVTLFFYKA